MSVRTKARKRALDVLYSAEQRGLDLASALAEEEERAASQPARAGSWSYARDIIAGVAEHSTEIDELIETYAQGWTIARMPALDRALARIAIWELVHNPEVPHSVAIAEAVEAARVYSTDDSAGFLGGLLGRIASTL
ncbi:MAG TPA: transcription antitermination factor NusB [Terrimesophilobacter sp.]|nr:transcription antitermination factor NusB [Terrimesophilobacter sp.]